MLPRIIRKADFASAVRSLMGAYRVVAPVARGPQAAFEVIDGPKDVGRIRMDYDQTILPPKKFVMPQYEDLLSYTTGGPEGVKAQNKVVPTVILGVHPYDLHGLATTDAAMQMDPMDTNYHAKRKAVVLVGLNVKGYINEHQFMADMRTLDAPAGGFDLFLTDLGDRYYVEIGSEVGSRLGESCTGFAAAKAADHQDKQAYDHAKAANCPKRLPYDTRYLPELLGGVYDSLLWDAVAKRCFSCGTCTNVCPTCYCFDVQDFPVLGGTGGVRRRAWDSCQLKCFAEIASGENFRKDRASRLRHRVFRKGRFILERTGKLGCVGCGRCSLHCVAKISILETLRQIADQTVVRDA